MNRMRAADVSELHVERVLPAVRVESLLVEPVRPWREQRHAGEAGARSELVERCVRKVEDLVTLDFHPEGHVAERRRDRDNGSGSRVFEPHDLPVAPGGILRRGWRGETEQQ